MDDLLDRGWARLAPLLDAFGAWWSGQDGRKVLSGLRSVPAAVAGWRPELGVRGRKFGIKGRLFCAFVAIAGTTVIASIAAMVLFSQVGAQLKGVAGKNIPEVIATLELARETQSLAAGAPGLLAASSQEERQRQLKALQDIQGQVRQRLDGLAVLESGRRSTEALLQLNGTLNDRLAGLDGLVGAGLDLRQRRGEAEQAITATRAKLLEILNAALATELGTINIITMSPDSVEATDTPLGLIHRHMLLVQNLTTLADKINSATGLLIRAAQAPDAAAVEALRKEFVPLGQQVEHQILVVETLQTSISAHDVAAPLLAQEKDGSSLFDIRMNELKNRQEAQKTLADASQIIAELTAEVGREVDAVRQATDAATQRSTAAVGFGTVVMLAIALISVVGSFLFIWLYVGRNLVARLVGFERSMTRIAGGELSIEIT
ncbi:MAG: hypothetical protein JO255_22475, partial [Alphaproteobacteria bacterium]|nr:hypothetical protein [Alphaproteobacteria bacterium]